MPVYWFAVSQVLRPDAPAAILIFVIIHGLVYPSSNGYNSYMDRDTGPVGGIEKPLLPQPQLLKLCNLMDIVSVLLGLLISRYFAIGLLLYILASRAYSSRRIRIKKYPFAGYLIVMLCQGALVFFLVYHGCHPNRTLAVPLGGVLAAALMIGGFYPLTQIYQHEADRLDGVRTISSVLGIRGTFVFTAVVYTIAMLVMALFLLLSLEIKEFLAYATIMLPVIVYFAWWASACWKNPARANFSGTMRMSLTAAICSNLGFIVVFLMHVWP
jgi:1,4-dihydroxy-2-naphthoate octaprenyltransferase